MAGKSKITSNLKINIDYEIENSQKIRKEIEKILNSGNFSDSINRDLQKKIDTLKKVEKELNKVPDKGSTVSNEQLKNINKYAQLISKTADQSKELANRLSKVGLTKDALKQIEHFEKNIEDIKKQFEQLSGKSLVDTNQKPIDDYIIKLNKQIAKQEQLTKQQPKFAKSAIPVSDKTEKARQKYEDLMNTVQQYNKVLKQMQRTQDEGKKSELGIQATGKVSTGTETGLKKEIDALTGKANKAQLTYQQSMKADEEKYIAQLQEEKKKKLELLKLDKQRAVQLEKDLQTNVAGINSVKSNDANVINVKTITESAKALDSLQSSSANYETNIAKATESTLYWGDALDSLKNEFMMITSFGFLIEKTISTVNKAATQTKEIDKDMVQIGLVLQETSSAAWKNFSTYSKTADRLSTTTSEVTAAMKLFYQQGLNTTEVNKMVEASAIAAALGESTLADAAETLTSVVNSYGLTANQAMDVTDKISQIAIVSAADFGELSIAIEKVASSAASAGLDLDHLMGYLGKMIETTREAPTNIGTALKTIVANFTQFKEDPTFTTDEGTSVNDVDEALKTVGIELKNSEGQIKDLGTVIDELGGKWDGLNKNQKSYLATTIAGTRQQSRFYALMNDYDRTLELVNEGTNSAGKASQQFALYQNSLTASTQRLENQWQKFYNSITSGDTLLKGFYNTLTSIMTIVNKLGPGLTLVLGGLGLKGGRNLITSLAQSKTTVQSTLSNLLTPQNLAGVSSQAQQSGEAIGQKLAEGIQFGAGKQGGFNDKLGSSIFSKLVNDEDLTKINQYNAVLDSLKSDTLEGLTQNYQNLLKTGMGPQIEALTGLNAAEMTNVGLTQTEQAAQVQATLTKSRDTAITNVNTAAKWANVAAQAAMTLGVTALIAGVTALLPYILDWNKYSREQAAKAEEAYNEIQTENKTLEDSIKTYNELTKKVSLTSKEKEELASANEELAKNYPELINGYDSEGNAILKNTQYLKEYLKVKKQESQEKAKTMAEKTVKASNTYNKGLMTFSGKIKDSTDLSSESAKTALNSLEGMINKYYDSKTISSDMVSRDTMDTLTSPDTGKDFLEKYYKDRGDTKELEQIFNTAKKVFSEDLKGIQNLYTDYYNDTIDLVSYEQNNLSTEQSSFVEGLSKTFANATIGENVEKIVEQYKKGEVKYADAKKQINEYLEGQGAETVETISKALAKLAKSSDFEKVKSLYDEYTTAQTKGYSFLAQENLASKLTEQINHSNLPEDQKKALTDSVTNQQEQLKKDMEDSIKQAMAALTNTNAENIDTSSEQYKQYEEIFKNLSTDSQQAFSDAIQNFTSGENDDYTYTDEERQAIAQQIIPNLTEILNKDNVGREFSQELSELDFTDSIDVENFKAKWGAQIVQKFKDKGYNEQIAIDLVNAMFPEPGNISKEIQKKMGNLETSFNQINKVDISDLTSGEMSVTSAASSGVLDLGFTVQDKFIASTETVTKALGEANEKMLTYIEELRRSAEEEIKKANESITQYQSEMEEVKKGRADTELSYDDQQQVKALQDNIAKQKEIISTANQRLQNAKNLTKEYQQQDKELQYIKQYSEVENAARSVNTLVDSIDDLADAWEKANKGTLSQLDIVKMIAKDSSMLQFLEVENGQLKLSASGMEKYAEAKAKTVKESIQLDIDKLESLYNMIDADHTYTESEMIELGQRAESEVNAANKSKEVKQGEVKNTLNVVKGYEDASAEIDSNLQDITDNTAKAAKSSVTTFGDLLNALGEMINHGIQGAKALGSAIAKALKGDINFSDVVNVAVGDSSNKIRSTYQGTSKKKEAAKDNSSTTGTGNSSADWANFEVGTDGKLTGSEWQKQIKDKIEKLKAIQNAISGSNLLKKVGEMGDKDKDKDKYEASVEHLEHFYNYLRKIESLQAKITKLQTKGSTLDLTKNYNIDALKQENGLLKEQAKLYGEYIGEEGKYLATLRKQLTSTFSDWVYFTKEGIVQVKQTDFAINSEKEEKRYKAFNDLLEEYQSEYQTYLENQNTLLETQQQIIENIKSSYEKITAQLDDTISNLEYMNSISEHNTDMSVGNLQELSAYNQQLSTTIDMYTYASKTLSSLKADMAQITQIMNSRGLSQYMKWNSGTNQYQASDYFNQRVLAGNIDSETVTMVQALVSASQTLNEQWQSINDKVMSIESSLKTIVEDRLQAIENLLGGWKDEISDIFDIINRQKSIKDTLFDLTGYNTGDLEAKYKLLANAAAMTKNSWDEMKKLSASALNEITKNYGEFVTMIDGTPFINETAIKESNKLSNEQKAKAEELIATYKALKETTDDLEDSTYDYLSALKELQEKQLSQTIDVLQKIHDALKEIDQEELQDLQDKYDKMNSLDEEYYNNLSQRISDARDQRNQLQNQQTLAQKQQQLGALQRDSSGAYNSQIISLQQEINSLMQSNADTDVDNELERIQREQEERQADRDIQIQQLENLITFKDDNDVYWQQANEMLAEGYQAVSGFLASREQNNDQSELATQEAIAQTNQQLADVYAKLGNYSAEDLQTSTDIKQMLSNFLNGDGNSVSGLLNKLGLLDSDITSNLTASVTAISSVINNGFAQGLATIQNGYNTFWNQFDQLRNNINGNSTGIIDALNYSTRVASQDAATITGIGRLINANASSTSSSSSSTARNTSSIADHTSNLSPSGSISRGIGDLTDYKGTLDYHLHMIDDNTWHSRDTLWDIAWKVKNGWTITQGRVSLGGSFLAGLGLNISGSYGRIYKTGGYADYTGPAWVDGTKTKPEAFLNAKQTQLFEQLRDNLTASAKTHNTKDDEENKGDTINIDTIAIQVKELADSDTVDKVVKKVKSSIYTDATGKNTMQVRRR